MDEINADVWVLTETSEEISPGADYQGVATTEWDRPAHGPSEVWTKVWSRWPVERLDSPADPARCVAVRIVPPTRGPFVVYGTVLPWPSSAWRGLPYRGGLAFGAALDAQAGDWARLQTAHPGHDLFVMGDLNQDLCITKPRYCGSRLNQGRLRQTLADSSLVAFTDGANDPVRRDSAPRACIDHICGPVAYASRVHGTMRWPDTPTPVKGLSDHFGVAVDLD